MDKIMTWWEGLIVIYRKVALQMPGLKKRKPKNMAGWTKDKRTDD